MGARATPCCASNRLQRRTGASSAIATFASDYPFETAELMRRGAAALSYRVRRFALFRCSAFRVGTFTFAAFGSAYEPRTRTCPACLSRAEYPGDRRWRRLEFADGEKASSRHLPEARSQQPQ